MSIVKRYEVNGSSSVFEDDNGCLVDYQDYAALEAKCAALAAEVEAVKSAHQDAVDTIIHTANRTGVLYTEKTIQMSCKTPSTDAFLAEVRAQDVDGAITELNHLAERSEKEAPIASEHHRSAALYLQLFSAQLRQEAAQ